MSEQNPKWADDLKKVHEQLRVDEHFKAELRRTLIEEGQEHSSTKAEPSQQGKQRRWHKYKSWTWGAAAVVIATIVLLWNLLPGQNLPRVNAADLQLKLQFNTLQQLGQETSVAVAMDQDTTYYAVPKQGIYRQRGLAYEQIVSGDVSELALSPDGKQLAYVDERKLQIWAADTEQTKLVLEAPVPLSGLAWSQDGTRLAYVRQGQDPAVDTIWEMQLQSGEQRNLTKGSSPSYLLNEEKLLYAKQEQIYTLDLKSGTEQLWGDGYSPVISPDGKYVLYVRKDGDDLELEDAWVSDLDRRTEQRITHNRPMDAWKDGQPQETGQQPSYALTGLAWNTDGQSIAMYQVTETNTIWRQLVRYTLTEQEAGPEEVVAQAIEALIYRDERHAHEFFNYDPGYLKGTSPRQVGYTIVNTAVEADGQTVVTAKIDYSHYDPYYRVDTYRFTLSQGSEGYLIDNMEEIDSIRITDWSGEMVTTTGDDQRDQLIFRSDQVPTDRGWTNVGFGNIVYRESDSGRKIWFLVKQQQDDRHRMRLMRYDWDQGTFQALGILDGMTRSSMMIIDESEQWAAIDAALGEGQNDIAVLPLKAADSIPVYLSTKLRGPTPYQTIDTRLWKVKSLSFYVEWNDRDVFFEYRPE